MRYLQLTTLPWRHKSPPLQGHGSLLPVLLLFAFCYVWASPTAYAQLFLEPYLSQATDPAASHLFLLNPAAGSPKALDFNLVSTKVQENNKLVTAGRDGGLDTDSTVSAVTAIAIAVVSNLGGGLAAGLTHQQLRIDDTTKTLDRGDTQYLENIGARYSTARAQVEVSDSITLGFVLRYLEAEIDLIGSFNVSSRDRTIFKTSLFGAGGGLVFTVNKHIHFGAAYLPVMKGTTEIYAEEKIVTEPGVAEFAMANDHKPYHMGVALRRWLYKRDDRVDGTTLNNENNTAIDLLGLNVERNTIFPLDERQLSIGYELTGQSTLTVSAAQHTAIFVTDPKQGLPGENASDRQYSYYVAKIFLQTNSNNLQFFAGLAKGVKNTRFSRGNNATITFTGDYQHLTLGLGAHL